MNLKIIVGFLAENEESERRLGEIYFVESQGSRHVILEAPPTKLALSDGTQIQVSASYSPSNSGTSLVVCHEQKQIALVLTNWETGNLYLGVQIERLGFLHLYCQKE